MTAKSKSYVTTFQVPTTQTAVCTECGKEYTARTAQEWAHLHASRTGHDVELRVMSSVRKVNIDATDAR